MQTHKTLRLILGDQLNANHPWFQKNRPDTIYTLMEVRQETDATTHHIQKVVGFFSAMRHFAADLSRRGHRVVYFRLDDPQNEQHFEDNLRKLIQKEKITRFEYLLPDEYRLDRQMSALAAALPVSTGVVDTAHFLTEREDLARWFEGKKRFLMESFYRHMRKKHNLLMESGKPHGGRWNYDQSNRQCYDGAVPLPEPPQFENDVADIVEMIDHCGVKTIGRIDPQRFVWPVNRRQALRQLQDFIDNRLAHFGTYQDAMTKEHRFLFHSLLSFALNTKMLHPQEVIQAALLPWQASDGEAFGIEQLEGFVRQILGWREFVRGIYWAHMPDYEKMNHFGHRAPLPDAYWTAETDMHCLRRAVSQSLENAYAHHIQRLMVTGNFALLAGVHPDEVDAWYLGIYIDAVQWVEIVNTRGMSQYADGGIVATKPYISSANYIHKMSDYCNDCRYVWKKKTGQNACPFNSLFWDFVDRNRQLLVNNHRMGMILRTWDRMKPENRDRLLRQAQAYKQNINAL